MPVYSKDSLESLRNKIDLVDVLSSHMDLKKAGAAYKGLCPFHDEKTPSFMIQKGDTHYHCFGCGAHGDAIQFLMAQQKLSFTDAVQSLASRYGVHLQTVEGTEQKQGPNKAALKEVLEIATEFYQLCLLHTPEGHQALQYLYKRGIDLDFIRAFRIGLAPKERGALRRVLHGKFIKDEIMAEAGLIAPLQEGNGWRDFFSDRITFPICDAMGATIGFSARKYKEETFGGKYINTSETPLFKKSYVLFGLHYCRKRIAKERQVIIVEGQIDALRLIHSGFNITVAGQGTAFGEGHVKELMNLGINKVLLALDSDTAGQQAILKIGDLFQLQGVDVRVIELPQGSDPDSFLREMGPQAFLEKMQNAIDYLTFVVKIQSTKVNMQAPAGKNQLVHEIAKQIRRWNHPLMVHESLRKLAHLTQVPEAMVGVGQEYLPPNNYIKRSEVAGMQTIDSDRILETDFLRWLLLFGHTDEKLITIAKDNIYSEMLYSSPCRQLYEVYLRDYTPGKACDFLSLLVNVEDAEIQSVIEAIHDKKVKPEKIEEQFIESIRMILNRNWMQKREALKVKIQISECSDDEAIVLSKELADLNRQPPQLTLPS